MRNRRFLPSWGHPGAAPRSRERGTSLVEVLVASAVMAVLMVGVLQLFSLALFTNFGSAARTDLTYRSQQVVENLRMIQYFAKTGNKTPADNAGVTVTASGATGFTIASTGGSPVTISNTSAFWQAAGVVVNANDPFRISYNVVDMSTSATPPSWSDTCFLINVTAVPVDAPGSGTTGVPGYFSGQGAGGTTQMKRVDYVVQIPR
jgi:Tfp pilus assembly protein PilV